MEIREQYEAKKAAQGRRAQEAVPKPWWWLGQHDPIARFTKWLVLWTALLFVGTIVSAGILWKTDHTLYETLLATQRPWVSVELSPVNDLSIGQDGIDVQIEFKLRNTGKSPAVGVAVSAKLIPDRITRDVIEDQKTECQSFMAFVDRVGFMVFPDEIFPHTSVVTMSRKEIDEELGIRKKEWEASKQKARMPQWIDTRIVGCVVYKFSFGPPREIHETGFSARLETNAKGMGFTIPIDVSKATIPRKDLVIDRNWSFVGSYAN